MIREAIVFTDCRVSIQNSEVHYCDEHTAEIAIIEKGTDKWLTQTFDPDAGDDVLAHCDIDKICEVLKWAEKYRKA